MALLWTRLYPVMYYVDFYEKKGLQRERAYANMADLIGTNCDVIYPSWF